MHWDDVTTRKLSQRDTFRSECVCAGDGEPISELECVLSNREWIENVYRDQYELLAVDPTVTKDVQTHTKYLYCPGQWCEHGHVEGCWYQKCFVGSVCENVTANVKISFSGLPQYTVEEWSNNVEGVIENVRPYRLNKDTLVFGMTKILKVVNISSFSNGQVYYTPHRDWRYVAVFTDMEGNVKDVRTKTAISTTLLKEHHHFYNEWSTMDVYSEKVTVSDFGRSITEESQWCQNGWFDEHGCHLDKCNHGFVEEQCDCKDTPCHPGQYCTAEGECEDWVKKDKRFLQIKYKHENNIE